MSGAGFSPAGYSPAGTDLSVSSPRTGVLQHDPVRYDPKTRTFPLTEDGLVETIHWVDAVVALALTINLGSHASNPTLGNKLRRIIRAAGPALQSQVEDIVSVALRAPLDRKDILVTQVLVATPIRGQVVVVVTYINLRTNPHVPKNVSVAIR